MLILFGWRVHVEEQQIDANIDERVESAALRVASSVQPLVSHLYQRAHCPSLSGWYVLVPSRC